MPHMISQKIRCSFGVTAQAGNMTCRAAVKPALRELKAMISQESERFKQYQALLVWVKELDTAAEAILAAAGG